MGMRRYCDKGLLLVVVFLIEAGKEAAGLRCAMILLICESRTLGWVGEHRGDRRSAVSIYDFFFSDELN